VPVQACKGPQQLRTAGGGEQAGSCCRAGAMCKCTQSEGGRHVAVAAVAAVAVTVATAGVVVVAAAANLLVTGQVL